MTMLRKPRRINWHTYATDGDLVSRVRHRWGQWETRTFRRVGVRYVAVGPKTRVPREEGLRLFAIHGEEHE